MASEHFHHIYEWQIAICKECRVAVWPDQAIAHLQNKQHQLRRKEAQAIVDDLESWPGIVQGRSEFQLPEILQEPVAEFLLYTDRLQY